MAAYRLSYLSRPRSLLHLAGCHLQKVWQQQPHAVLSWQQQGLGSILLVGDAQEGRCPSGGPSHQSSASRWQETELRNANPLPIVKCSCFLCSLFFFFFRVGMMFNGVLLIIVYSKFMRISE